MAAVFYHNQEQKDEIEKSLARFPSEIKAKMKTQVLPFTGFTRAEDYHQKYTLRQSKVLMKEFQRMYPSSEGFVDSTAAARINGYLAGHGRCEQLKTEIDDMGLSPEGAKRLLKVVCGRR